MLTRIVSLLLLEYCKTYVLKLLRFAKGNLTKVLRECVQELGLPLYGNDLKAIHLNTLYLKFDNHEWGMCGFVDLNDNRVSTCLFSKGSCST